MSILITWWVFGAVAASADTVYRFDDGWADWNNESQYYTGIGDEYGNPRIESMAVRLDDSGYLKSIQLSLASHDWVEFNSLFINSYAVTTTSTAWDDWDYYVYDNSNSNQHGQSGLTETNGVYTVGDGTDRYTTATGTNVRAKNPNGIKEEFLSSYSDAVGWYSYGGKWHNASHWDGGYAWNNDQNAWQYTKTYDFTTLTGFGGIDLSDGFFIAFAPYCANDVIGGGKDLGDPNEPAPVPEPATLALLGLGLLGLAGAGKRRGFPA